MKQSLMGEILRGFGYLDDIQKTKIFVFYDWVLSQHCHVAEHIGTLPQHRHVAVHIEKKYSRYESCIGLQLNATVPYVISLRCENETKPHGRKPRGAFLMGGETMPRKPKRPCSYPGCPELTDGRFCEEHQKQENKRYEKYDRDPAVHRRYGRAWKRIRDRYVSQHPFCELCYAKGILVETEEVHHKKPLSQGGTHDAENLISLCKSCHARIHAESGDRWHNRPKNNA